MSRFPCARFTISDAEVWVVLLDASAATFTSRQMLQLHAELQACAEQQGFHGTITMAWQDALGFTRFLAPPEQHAFFQIVSYRQLLAQAHETLSCGLNGDP